MAPAQSGPVLTSVAPRDRPVTTSLAPRQRPKGNNKTFVSEDDSAAPFKNSNNSGGSTLQRGTKLRRSQSLKESKNLSGNNSPKVEKRQLQNQTPSVSQQQLYHHHHQQQQQNFDIQAQQQQAILTQDQQQYLLMQQQRQQQEIFMRQQQQQYQYYQQLHQQKLQQQQQQQQQQHYLIQQQRQQQEYIQHQREILMRQQEQDMLQRKQQEQILRQQQQQEELLRQQQEMQKQEQLRQQQQQEYMRQRQEEYSRLQKLREQEENNSFRDRLDTDDFNPRQCRSVEPPKSPELKHKNLFDDDFTRSSPDLVNPFAQNATQKSNPFQEKKKTHARSRSDTFTRLANRSDFLNKENKLDTAPEEMTSSQSSGNIHETVEQDKNFSQGVPLGQNPFIPYSGSTANKIDSNKEEGRELMVEDGETKSKQERSVELERQDSNVETGILLEIDDDENFIRLQKELKELGVLNDMPPLQSSNKDSNTDKTDSMIGEQRKRTQSDVSPLISPLATSPDNERKYIYKRSSSCSSSEKDSSDFSDDDTDDKYDTNVNKMKTPRYEGLKHDQLKEHPGTVKSSELEWQEKSSKDIFDLAPFVKTKQTRTEQKKLHSNSHKPEQTKTNQIERRNAKKVKSPTIQNDVYSPFDDDFSKDPSNASNSTFRSKLNSDPFKMAPMKISKGKEKAKLKDKDVTENNVSAIKGQEVKVKTSNVNINKNSRDPFEGNNFTSNNSNYEDPFGSAPFSKITSKNFRNVPSSELHVRVKPRNKRMLPNIPNSSASSVTGITTSHR